MNLLEELKRRNVIRMAGLYLVGAWLIIQIAETLLPAFDVPGWVLRAVIILLAIGFIPALIVSWLFELTPAGLKRDAEVDPSQSIAPSTARRMDRLLVVGMLVVVALIAADRFWPSADPAPASAVAQPDASTPETETTVAPAAPTAAPNSIAVLPFLNMSTDEENGFFADGISEELLNVLARIDGLTVASRTSAFSFKGKDTPIPEIARLLDVRHVLEGSVRKQGNRVRITAQLIRAGTDKHLWSQTFDRDLDDIFKVQEEIAQAITAELMGVLPIGGVTVQASTSNLDAYEKFLSGRARFFQRTELNTAIADLQFAVENDPNLAEAWVYLAATYEVLSGYEDVDLKDTADKSAAALTRAAELAPQHPMLMALLARQTIYAGVYEDGLAQMAKAAALRSPDSTPVLMYGYELLFAGYLDEARVVLERAQAKDPLSGINIGYVGLVKLALGNEKEGLADVDRSEKLGWPGGTMVYAFDQFAQGKPDRLLTLVGLPDGPFSNSDSDQTSALRDAINDPRKVDDYLALVGPNQGIELIRGFGRADQGLDEWLAAEDDINLSRLNWIEMRTVWLPSASALREDPRLFKIAEKRGVVKLWETRGYPPGCSRVRDPKGDHLDCPGMRP